MINSGGAGGNRPAKTKRKDEIILTRLPGKNLDTRRARGFLRDFARKLDGAADARDGRELLSAIDLVRRGPTLVRHLEAR